MFYLKFIEKEWIILLFAIVIIHLDMIPSNKEDEVCIQKAKSFQLLSGSQGIPISDTFLVQESKRNKQPIAYYCQRKFSVSLKAFLLTPLDVETNPGSVTIHKYSFINFRKARCQLSVQPLFYFMI